MLFFFVYWKDYLDCIQMAKKGESGKNGEEQEQKIFHRLCVVAASHLF